MMDVAVMQIKTEGHAKPRQITIATNTNTQFFYGPNALPVAKPTLSKH